MTIKRLGIIDFETTSLDPSTGYVIEAAFGVYDLEHASLIEVTSRLVKAPPGEVERTRKIHGIPSALPEKFGHRFESIVSQIREMLSDGAVDVMSAYNAKFDKSWLPSDVADACPWVCLCDDIEWPRESGGKSLLAVAHAHGVQIGSLHRAANDVLLCADLLTRAHELGADLVDLVTRGLRPKVRYRANVSFDTNQLAKDAGFRWDPAGKMWWKEFVPEDVAALNLPFEIREV